SGRLAGTVRAEEAEELAGRDGKVDAVEGGDLPVDLAKSADFDGGMGHDGSLLRASGPWGLRPDTIVRSPHNKNGGSLVPVRIRGPSRQSAPCRITPFSSTPAASGGGGSSGSAPWPVC